MNRINRNRYIASIMALCLGVMTAALHAAEQAGKILYSRGSVSIVDVQDSARGGRTGAPLFEGDRIVTGTGAIAQIRLSDGALVALRGSSDYQIETQQYDEEEDLYEQAGKLFTGWMRSITGAIGQKYPQKVSQSTTVATIGIRGTTYQVISIPPEGLPEYPGEEPGTYVMLEEGQVEITGDAGSRLLKPGDIVFIPAAGGAPQLRPEKNRMFERPSRRIVRQVLERREEFSRELNQALVETLLARRGETAVMGFVDGVGFAATREDFLLGFDPARHLTGVRLEGSPSGAVGYEVTNAAAIPLEYDRHVFRNGDVANWGTWSVSDYQGFDASGLPTTTPFGDWQWLIADGTLVTPADVMAAGFRGVATYGAVGGTALQDPFGMGYNIKGGGMVIDFATGALNVELELIDIETTLTVLSSFNESLDAGVASLTDLYGSGVFINDGQTQPFWTGNVKGAIIAGGNGIGTTVSLFDGSNSYTTVGVFERLPIGGELAALGFVDGYSFFADASDIETTSGTIRALTRLDVDQMDAGTPDFYQLPATPQPVAEYGSHPFANGATVNWGIWSETGGYESRDESFNTLPVFGDWKWIVADGVLKSPLQLASAGLTGTATYNYVGGTTLSNASVSYTVGGGSIDVDFATGGLNVVLDVLNGQAGWSLTSGNAALDPAFANIGQFYRDGVFIQDAVDPNAWGDIQGVFVANGEGIASTVSLFDGANGIAVFGKVPEIVEVVAP
jgi:hypothetical protein